MWINIPMVRRMALRAVSGHFVSIYSLASETITLCPEESVTIPRAIYLDGALDRITGLSIWRNLQQEKELIFGGQIIAHPTNAYRIEKVDLVGAYLYKSAAKSRQGFDPEQLFLMEHRERQFIERACLVTTVAGSLFFGPLLVDDFPLELIAPNPEENIRMVTKYYHQEDAYRQLLGLEKTPLVHNARINQLTLYSQPAINSLRTLQYRQLREKLRSNFTTDDTGSKAGVYLKRGTTGEYRILQNEEEIETLLADIGFDIVEPAKLSVEEIARKTMNAKIVVSVEGSHKSHVIFSMADDGAFVVLQPPDRFSMVYKEFADCMGMKFAFLVGDTAQGGFSVQLDQLRRIIDLVG